MVAATHRLTPTTHTTHVRCRIRYVNCCLTLHYQTQISPNIIKCFIVVYHTSNSCECIGIKLVFSSTQSPSWGCAQNTVGILWCHSITCCRGADCLRAEFLWAWSTHSTFITGNQFPSYTTLSCSCTPV